MQQPSHSSRRELTRSSRRELTRSSRRELTRSSQNEPSSSAACQWKVSTLTKSWEVTKLNLFGCIKQQSSPELALPLIRNGQSIRERHFCHRLLRRLLRLRPRPGVITKIFQCMGVLVIFYR